MQIDLTGQVAVITGAGRGIGEGLARRFAAEGARVVLLDRSPDDLSRVEREINAASATAISQVVDVRDESSVSNAINQAFARFGRIDILINNAGIAPEGRIESMALSDWEDTFAANTRGVFLCTRAVIPYMKKARAGRILNASSFAAIIPSIGFAAYSASKAAVVSFTRVLAAELGPWGITANSYAPGMVPTPLNGYAEADAAKQTRLLNTLSLRHWGTPDEIASLLIFLASSHAAYITGASIEISGGKYAVQFPQLAYETPQ